MPIVRPIRKAPPLTCLCGADAVDQTRWGSELVETEARPRERQQDAGQSEQDQWVLEGCTEQPASKRGRGAEQGKAQSDAQHIEDRKPEAGGAGIALAAKIGERDRDQRIDTWREVQPETEQQHHPQLRGHARTGQPLFQPAWVGRIHSGWRRFRSRRGFGADRDPYRFWRQAVLVIAGLVAQCDFNRL